MSIKILKNSSSNIQNIKHIIALSQDSSKERIARALLPLDSGDVLEFYRLNYPVYSNVIEDKNKDATGDNFIYTYGDENYLGQIEPTTGFYPPKVLTVENATLVNYYPETGNFVLSSPTEGADKITLNGACRVDVKINMKNTGTYTYSPTSYVINTNDGEYYGDILMDYNSSLTINLLPNTDKGLEFPSTISVTGTTTSTYTYDKTTGIITLSNVTTSPITITAECPRGNQLSTPTVALSGDLVSIQATDDRTQQYGIYVGGTLRKTIDKSE